MPEPSDGFWTYGALDPAKRFKVWGPEGPLALGLDDPRVATEGIFTCAGVGCMFNKGTRNVALGSLMATDAVQRTPNPRRMGKGWFCKPCYNKKSAKWRRQRQHGLRPGEFEAMGEAQQWRCALCRNPETLDKQLSIDHDHECCDFNPCELPYPKACGKCVRALLCGSCNFKHNLKDDTVSELLWAIYTLWWRRERRGLSEDELLIFKAVRALVPDIEDFEAVWRAVADISASPRL